jgi:D-alanyl-D-alanine dipeptidase
MKSFFVYSDTHRLHYGMNTGFGTIVSVLALVIIAFSSVCAFAAPMQDSVSAGGAIKPPKEEGKFRKPDLAELIKLDPTIRLDVRYAKSNNFVGRPLYKEERAFMQRPAAEALVKAHRNLKQYGYGLLIFDGYRPWRVTKLFWDVTPAPLKKFVANPAQGSRHNRGCAVDLSLFDLKTGKEIPMPSEYDEMTDRAYPAYTGGTDEQRRTRDLLKQEMEKQGFAVFSIEWWHFDYKDWREYPVLDIDFSEIK